MAQTTINSEELGRESLAHLFKVIFNKSPAYLCELLLLYLFMNLVAFTPFTRYNLTKTNIGVGFSRTLREHGITLLANFEISRFLVQL